MKTLLSSILVLFVALSLSACNTTETPQNDSLPTAQDLGVENPAPGAPQAEPGDTPPPSEPKGPRSYDSIKFALAKKNSLLPTEFKLGIQKLTLTHFKGVVQGKEGRVLAAKQGDDWVIVHDGAYGESSSYTCESIKGHNFPEEMVSDCL